MVSSEAAAVASVAARYREQGYEVSLEPPPSVLPEIVRYYQPDFVAVRGAEHIAVEVRLQSALGADPDLTRTAEHFRKIPGWRLDLAVVDDSERAPAPPLLSPDDARERIAAAELAGSTGDHAGALLLLWTALEAILRARMAEADEDRPMPSARLVKSAYSLGLLEEEQFPLLEWMADVRNDVVHGRKATEVTAEEYQRARRLVLDLIGE